MTPTQRRYHLSAARALLDRAAQLTANMDGADSGRPASTPPPEVDRLIKRAAEHEHLAMRIPSAKIAEITERHKECEAKEVPTLVDLGDAHADREFLLQITLGEWTAPQLGEPPPAAS